MLQKIETIRALRDFVAQQRRTGKTIAFVPTMGALHDGHVALVQQGLTCADICIPYIFLNPKQFGPAEDLDKYPKTLTADLEKLENVCASAVYIPRVDDIYPEGFSTAITVSGISEPLEGEYRPHFFTGVATIVAKMLLQCLPDIALFGEKDFQQLQVIKHMVRDLNIPVSIIGVPTVRDKNGLALSSRNVYLTPEQYNIACQMNMVLSDMLIQHTTGDNCQNDMVYSRRLLSAGFDRVDYCTLRDAETLLPPTQNTRHIRALAAAWIGTTRLIDNKGA